jgi:hypothetical protein
MKKTSLLMILGLALVLGSAAAPKANAGVVFGVGVGVPVYPVRAYGYVGPRYYAPTYYAPAYVGGAYVAPGPYVDYGYAPVYRRYYWRNHYRRDYDRRFERREFRDYRR